MEIYVLQAEDKQDTVVGETLRCYQEASVTVPVKAYAENSVIVSQAMVLLWGGLVVVIIPLTLSLAGLVIWLKR